MARINLLPWREQRRKERQRQFAFVAVSATVLAALVVAFVHIQINNRIDYQHQRNDFLEDRIAELNRKIEEIEELESTKEKLLARMEIIEQLQRSRPEVVHLFDEMVTTLPEGLYLKSMKQSGDKLVFEGRAESNARVSSYMRQLEESAWLKDPNLDVIETSQGERMRISDFVLQVKQTNPSTEGSGTDEGDQES